MIFASKKNTTQIAEFLGRYSVLFDNTPMEKKKGLMDTLHIDHLQLLESFFNARDRLRESLAANGNNGNDSTANGGDCREQSNLPH